MNTPTTPEIAYVFFDREWLAETTNTGTRTRTRYMIANPEALELLNRQHIFFLPVVIVRHGDETSATRGTVRVLVPTTATEPASLEEAIADLVRKYRP
jgi:hypothetical protein